MRPFKGTTIIYTEYTRNHPLFQRYCTLYLQTLKFAAIQFYQHPFFQRISEHQLPGNNFLIKAAVFSEQHRLYQNKSSHLKQIFFRRNIFFKIPTCLEQLLLPNNYSLVSNTFSNSYFLKINTFSAQRLFRRRLLSRKSNYSEHALFRGRCFFWTV